VVERIAPQLSLSQMDNSPIAKFRKAFTALGALPYYLVYCPLRARSRTARFLAEIYRYQRAERIAWRNRDLIRTVEPEQLFPGLFANTICLTEVGPRSGGATNYETCLLAALVRYLSPRILLEFGTGEGRTTLQLALNSPDDAVVYTLDLPDDGRETFFPPCFPEERSFHTMPVGGIFQSYAESRKIRQLLGDSAAINFDELRGRVDFVFIDGDHGYDYVKSDSEKAFSMLSPNGILLWHDYGSQWAGVARFVREAGHDRKLFHLPGTSLVIHGSSL
jgi:predicted O-methyltransferase YrrM